MIINFSIKIMKDLQITIAFSSHKKSVFIQIAFYLNNLVFPVMHSVKPGELPVFYSIQVVKFFLIQL